MRSKWGLVILLAVVVSSCAGRSATATSAEGQRTAGMNSAPTSVTTTTVEVTGQIEGTLLFDTVMRIPAPGGTVVVLDTAQKQVATVVARADGRFSVRLPPGAYLLAGRHGTFLCKRQPVTVLPNAVATVAFSGGPGIGCGD